MSYTHLYTHVCPYMLYGIGEEGRDRDVHQQRLGEAVEGAVPYVDHRAG